MRRRGVKERKARVIFLVWFCEGYVGVGLGVRKVLRGRLG